MYILLFFLVPASFIYYIAGRRDADIPSHLLAYISGLACGICALLLVRLLGLFIPLDSASVGLKFLTIFVLETGIPCILGIISLFFILEAPLKLKISNIRPQLFGVLTIFLPFNFVSYYLFPDMWAQIVLPMMILSFLFIADFFIDRFLPTINRSIDWIDALMAMGPVLLILILIDLCKALWYFTALPWVMWIASIMVIFCAFFLRLLKYRR